MRIITKRLTAKLTMTLTTFTHKKALGRVDHHSMLKALAENRIDYCCAPRKGCHSTSLGYIKFLNQAAVLQDVVTSPKLITNLLEYMFQTH